MEQWKCVPELHTVSLWWVFTVPDLTNIVADEYQQIITEMFQTLVYNSLLNASNFRRNMRLYCFGYLQGQTETKNGPVILG